MEVSASIVYFLKMCECPLTHYHVMELLSASLIYCINYFRRISRGSSPHEDRAAKACMALSAVSGGREWMNICKYLDKSFLS